MLEDLLLSIVGIILWIAAGLFDAAIGWFVLQMGNQIAETGIGYSIDIIWTIVRDLVNLTFIFGLVYVGFKMILSADTDAKKLLSSIIIGALLVNFSLFISKLVIDVSNVAAIEIYQQMNVQNDDYSTATVFLHHMGLIDLANPGLSERILRDTNTYVNPTGDQSGAGFLAFVIGAGIFILVAAFVFAAGAILLAIRFGVLVILMILSPIAFAATVLPGIEGWSKKWWRTLFTQAFFAPAYLFMLYVTLKIAEGYETHTRGFGKIFDNTRGEYDIGFSTAAFFTITIVMMVASILLARQMGVYGADKAISVGNYMRGTLQGYAGRGTLGRIGDSWQRRREAAGKPSTSIASRIANSMSTAKFGSSVSQKETREANEKARQVRARNQPVRNITDSIFSGIGRGATIQQRSAAVSGSLTNPDQQQLGGVIRNASAAQLKALGSATVIDRAADLKQSQVDDIMKSDDYTETEKGALKQKREVDLTARFNANPAGFFDDMKDTEVANLPKSILLQNAAIAQMTPGMLAKMQDTLARADRNTIKGSINPGHPAHGWLRSPRGSEF